MLSDQDMQDIAVLNEELKAELARKENGEPVVLIVNGHQYGEVISKDEVTTTVIFHNRYSQTLTAQLEKDGFKAVRGLRVIKANGNRMYLVQTPEGPDVYTMGRCHPAMRKKR